MPTARPGRRAPHVWLSRDGQRVSTIDLFGKGFVLLTGGSGQRWQHTASRIELRPPLVVQVIGGQGALQDEGGWTQAYGIEDDGAVLVRPDGYVAWRVRPEPDDPEVALRDVFDSVPDRGSRSPPMRI